jgi:hypothetical protein
MTQTQEAPPTELLEAEEVPLPEMPSVADLKAALKANVEGLQLQIANAREQKSKLNAQLAEDRAELTRKAEERRHELSEQIREALEQLDDAQRLLKATERPKRAKKAEK